MTRSKIYTPGIEGFVTAAVTDALGVERRLNQQTVYIVATSKKQAAELFSTRCSRISASSQNLTLVDGGDEYDILAEAGVFETGNVYATIHLSTNTPVVRIDSPRDATVIGHLTEGTFTPGAEPDTALSLPDLIKAYGDARATEMTVDPTSDIASELLARIEQALTVTLVRKTSRYGTAYLETPDGVDLFSIGASTRRGATDCELNSTLPGFRRARFDAGSAYGASTEAAIAGAATAYQAWIKAQLGLDVTVNIIDGRTDGQ